MKLKSDTEPGRDISLKRLQMYLQESIQYKFPNHDVEIGAIEADWPGSEDVLKCRRDTGRFINDVHKYDEDE